MQKNTLAAIVVALDLMCVLVGVGVVVRHEHLTGVLVGSLLVVLAATSARVLSRAYSGRLWADPESAIVGTVALAASGLFCITGVVVCLVADEGWKLQFGLGIIAFSAVNGGLVGLALMYKRVRSVTSDLER